MSALDWRAVSSSRITHEAYDATAECIYVRFIDGPEWCYRACPPNVWREFTAPGQSRGQFIARVLNHKPHGPHTG
jgi:KTSC domain